VVVSVVVEGVLGKTKEIKRMTIVQWLSFLVSILPRQVEVAGRGMTKV